MGLLRFLWIIDCRADLESENRIWSLWFVLCILNRAVTTIITTIISFSVGYQAMLVSKVTPKQTN